MGSKKLKAIAVKGTKSVKVAKPKEFLEACIDARNKLKAHPVTSEGLPTYGTQILINTLIEVGALPTRNWRDGGYFEHAEDISGETLTEKYLVRNKGCFGCSIGCGRVTRIPDGKYKSFGEGPEYEAGWAYGASCGVRDLEAVSKANFLCNEYGIDPITMGCTIACAMEMSEKGILSKDEIGMALKFGDADAIVKLTEMTGNRDGFGDKLAQGSYRLAASYGYPELSMSVKTEMPAYDARGVREWDLHMLHQTEEDVTLGLSDLSGSPWYTRKLDPLVTTDKASWLKTFQDLTAVIDSAGVCLLPVLLWSPEYSAMLREALGWEISDEEILRIGERIWNLERLFNIEAGLSKADDTLPERLLKEPMPSGPAKGKVVQLDEMLTEYYQVRGWDEEGIPTEDKLKELSII